MGCIKLNQKTFLIPTYKIRTFCRTQVVLGHLAWFGEKAFSFLYVVDLHFVSNWYYFFYIATNMNRCSVMFPTTQSIQQHDVAGNRLLPAMQSI